MLRYLMEKKRPRKREVLFREFVRFSLRVDRFKRFHNNSGNFSEVQADEAEVDHAVRGWRDNTHSAVDIGLMRGFFDSWLHGHTSQIRKSRATKAANGRWHPKKVKKTKAASKR